MERAGKASSGGGARGARPGLGLRYEAHSTWVTHLHLAHRQHRASGSAPCPPIMQVLACGHLTVGAPSPKRSQSLFGFCSA